MLPVAPAVPAFSSTPPLNAADFAVTLFAQTPGNVEMSLGHTDDGDTLLTAAAVLLPSIREGALARRFGDAVLEYDQDSEKDLEMFRFRLIDAFCGVGEARWMRSIRPNVVRTLLYRQTLRDGPLATPQEAVDFAQKIAAAGKTSLDNSVYGLEKIEMAKAQSWVANDVPPFNVPSDLYYLKEVDSQKIAIPSAQIYLWRWFLLSILRHPAVERGVFDSLRNRQPSDASFIFDGAEIFVAGKDDGSLFLSLRREGVPLDAVSFDRKMFDEHSEGLRATQFDLKTADPNLGNWVRVKPPREDRRQDAVHWFSAFLYAHRRELRFVEMPV